MKKLCERCGQVVGHYANGTPFPHYYVERIEAAGAAGTPSTTEAWVQYRSRPCPANRETIASAAMDWYAHLRGA